MKSPQLRKSQLPSPKSIFVIGLPLNADPSIELTEEGRTISRNLEQFENASASMLAREDSDSNNTELSSTQLQNDSAERVRRDRGRRIDDNDKQP
jgi:hypothetical protein